MQIKYVYDSSVSSAPAGFKTGLQAAANQLDAIVKDPITITVQVGWGEDIGLPFNSGQLSGGGPSGSFLPYSEVVTELTKAATSIDDLSAVKYLPANDPTNGGGFWVSYAQQKTWGLMPANSIEIDGNLGFNSNQPFTYDPNHRAVPGEYDMIGAAEQELSHVLDRFSSVLTNAPGTDTVFDLFRFVAPGVMATSLSQQGYFSVDGGTTNLGYLENSDPGNDSSDWVSSVHGDSFGVAYSGTADVITPTDVREMDVLGFNVGAAKPPPPVVVTPPPPPPPVVVPPPPVVVTPPPPVVVTPPPPVDYSGSTSSVTVDLRTLVGASTIIGSPQNDTFIAAPGEGIFTVNGGNGLDNLNINGAGYAQSKVSGSSAGSFTIAINGTTIHGSSIEQINFIDGTLTYDPSSVGAQVVRLYQAALGRLPDAPGLEGWVNAINHGVPLTNVADGFLNSVEFTTRFPGASQPGSFITQLYQNVLHRTPDATGQANWVAALSSGAQTKSSVLVSFSESAENRVNTTPTIAAGLYVPNESASQVARLYYSALGRPPDLPGLTGWASALTSGGLTLQQEGADFISSREFQATYGNLNAKDFVDLLYHNVLGRVADPAGEANWTSALTSGSMTQSGVLVGFSESQENINRLAPVIENSGIKFA